MAGINFAGVDTAMDACQKVRTYVDTGFDTTLDIAMDIQEHMLENGADLANELRSVMADYARMELEIRQQEEAVAWVKQQATDSANDDLDLADLMTQRLTQIQDRDSDIDPCHHARFTKLDSMLKKPLTNGTNHVVNGDADDDLQLTEAEINTKCPVTGAQMEIPVTNTVCGHIYDQRGVRQLIKQRKGKARCPVVGCGNTTPITEAHLREDKEMKRLIDRKQRKGKKK